MHFLKTFWPTREILEKEADCRYVLEQLKRNDSIYEIIMARMKVEAMKSHIPDMVAQMLLDQQNEIMALQARICDLSGE